MNNKGIKIWTIFMAVFMVIAIVANGFAFAITAESEVVTSFMVVFTILKIGIDIFGAYYVFVGCNKASGNVLLRVFFAIYAARILAMLFDPSVIAADYSSMVMIMIGIVLSFAGCILLAVAENLGELKSKIVVFVVLVCMAVKIVFSFFGECSLQATIWNISDAVTAIAAVSFIFAKYEDKRERKKENGNG